MDNHESTEEIEEAAGWGEVYEKLLSLEVNLYAEVSDVLEFADTGSDRDFLFIRVEQSSRWSVESAVERWLSDWSIPELPKDQEYFLKTRVLFAQTLCMSMQQSLRVLGGGVFQGGSRMNLQQTLRWLLVPVWERAGALQWARMANEFHWGLAPAFHAPKPSKP